jgi:hypothetical protein
MQDSFHSAPRVAEFRKRPEFLSFLSLIPSGAWSMRDISFSVCGLSQEWKNWAEPLERNRRLEFGGPNASADPYPASNSGFAGARTPLARPARRMAIFPFNGVLAPVLAKTYDFSMIWQHRRLGSAF